RLTASAIHRRPRTPDRKPGTGGLPLVTALLRFLREIPVEYRRPAAQFAWAVLRKCPEQLPGVFLIVFMGVHFCRFSARDVLPHPPRGLERWPAESEAARLPVHAR